MKFNKLLFLISFYLATHATESYAASKGAGGCNQKIDATVSYVQPYRFSESAIHKGMQDFAKIDYLFGTSSGSACLGLGLVGLRAQQKYNYNPTETTAASVALMQIGVGFNTLFEVDMWRFFKVMEGAFITPTLGIEGQAGLAANRTSKDDPNEFFVNNRNGHFTGYGARAGLRMRLFGSLGLHAGIFQGKQFFTFSGNELSYEVIRYDMALSFNMSGFP